MSSAAVLPARGNIVRDTQHFIQDTNVPQPRFPTCRPPAIPRFCLPDPPSLYPALVAIGADERVANEMNRAYNARALELRAYYEKSISSAFAALNDFPFPHDSEKRILDTFASLYLTKVKSWAEDGVAVYESSRKPTKHIACNNEVARDTNPRRSFNADYIPLLEHFFDENAFPTQADKRLLAKKSGMTYRQIHVWFQNRRNRTKKPNATWRKKLSCEPATHLHNTSRVCVEKSTSRNEQSPCAPSRPHQSIRSSGRSMQEDRFSTTTSHRMAPQGGDSNILDKCSAPPHAFPSPFPPVCSYNPFPLKSRSQLFSTPQWERCPNHSTPPQSPETDVNELTVRFSLLSVRDTYSKRSERNYGPTPDSLAATHSITITPSPAPHPALIKPANIVSSSFRLSPFPVVRASQPTPEVFTASAASSILISSPTKNDNVSRRKVSPLPKRFPPRSPLPCRDVTPAISDISSSTLSPCSSLRSLSDSFDFAKMLSPVPCPGSLTHPSSPQPWDCPAARTLSSPL